MRVVRELCKCARQRKGTPMGAGRVDDGMMKKKKRKKKGQVSVVWW